MEKANKIIEAEIFVSTAKDYVDFYNEFVKTFDLNDIQCFALSHLCELAEKYGAQLANSEAINELYAVYYAENPQEIGA